jgi:hypothetical protein
MAATSTRVHNRSDSACSSTPPVVTEADAARLAVGDLGDGPPTKDLQRRWEAIERYVTQQAYRA